MVVLNKYFFFTFHNSSGQTDANKDQLIHGHFDTKLNETGKKQATKAGKALKQVKFDKAISSVSIYLYSLTTLPKYSVRGLTPAYFSGFCPPPLSASF